MSAAEVSADRLTGWIAWAGGEIPVPGDTLVDVVLRCDSNWDGCTDAAEEYRWDWDNGSRIVDIVAYRVNRGHQMEPRRLAIGDKVGNGTVCQSEIIGIDGAYAWCRNDDGARFTALLANLVRA